MQAVSDSALGNPRVLIADSDQRFCRQCAKILRTVDCTVIYTLNGYSAMKLLETETYDLAIIDLKMGKLGGREILRRIKAVYPDTVVIVTTADPTVSAAVEVMKMGAFDYLSKPLTPSTLVAVAGQALAQRGNWWRKQKRKDRRRGDRESLLSHLVGTSSAINEVIDKVEKAAQDDSTVVIEGESGTGKELAARAIHAGSSRRDGPFFLLDCKTLAGELQAKELFGQVNGPFPDLNRVKQGIFNLAAGGTVLLDEIGNIRLDIQEKLFRFLESQEFVPVGGANVKKADIRLILTTAVDLQSMVLEGNLLENFHSRYCKDPIIIPPLRERKSDVMPIAYYFLQRSTRNAGKRIFGFNKSVVEWLMSYEWPGNVRQLRNVVERAVFLCNGSQITLKELPLFGGMSDIETMLDFVPTTNQELKQVKKEIRRKAVTKVEENFIYSALARNDWNVIRAARETGLQRPNFHSLMKKHGIKLPPHPKSE